MALYWVGMNRLTLTIFLSFCAAFSAQAADNSALSKTNILREADRCDMLGQKEITFLTSQPFKEIKNDLAKNRQLITQSLQQRYACYQDVLKELEAYLTAEEKRLGQQPLDVPALQQWQIDAGLRDTFILRQNISQELLLNILRDLEKTPADAAYMQESDKTKVLLQQDLSTLLDHTRRQLSFDEQRLWLGHPTVQDVLQTKLSVAANALSQAQLVYEQEDNKPLMVARLATLLASVPGDIYEIIAFNSADNKLDKKLLAKLAALVNEAEGLLDKIPAQTPEALYEGISTLQDKLLDLQQEAAK
jgi:hypothetical protein